MINKENDNTEKKVWTDAERLKLAEKLDQELEDYINGLQKKAYSDGWPEDCWQEEMEKHPFFMTQIPENPAEISPLVEGLQQLKYGEEYNTPNELAQSYKQDGNFNYKHKKYRLSILSFSKGIAIKCEDIELLAQLYNNRALAHLKLQNYKSSLRDCNQALKLKPDYLKSLHTKVKCYFNIKEYDECITHCDQILSKEINNDTISLRAQAIKNKKLLSRDFRLKELTEKKANQLKDKIIETIGSRKIKVDDSDLFYDSQCHVHLDDSNMLIWPVIFAYPENNQTDFIQNFNESTLLHEQLKQLFKESPAWDNNKIYQINNLNIYFEGNDKIFYKVRIDQTLKQILQHEKFIVKNGTPFFYILIAGSKKEILFLKNYE